MSVEEGLSREEREAAFENVARLEAENSRLRAELARASEGRARPPASRPEGHAPPLRTLLPAGVVSALLVCLGAVLLLRPSSGSVAVPVSPPPLSTAAWPRPEPPSAPLTPDPAIPQINGDLDPATVERIVGLHRASVKRACWDGVAEGRSSASMMITAYVVNGAVTRTSSTGDDPTLARCIEAQVQTWAFPAGVSTTIQIPFKFVRQ